MQGVHQGRVGWLAIKLTRTLKMNGLEKECPFNYGNFGVHVSFPGRTKFQFGPAPCCQSPHNNHLCMCRAYLLHIFID